MFKTEEELACVLIKHLEDKGWMIYQEVLIASRVLDILAIKDGEYWGIECKKALNLDVFEQAYYWRNYLDYTSICTPTLKHKYKRKTNIAKVIASNLELGFIVVSPNEKCVELVEAKKRKARLKKNIKLFEEQKEFAKAGSKNGYFTPFKKTCFNLEECVVKKPGILLKDALKEIDHHYANNNSAFYSLKKLLMEGTIKTGFYVLFEEGNIKLYPKIS